MIMKLAEKVQAWLNYLEWNDKITLDEEKQTSSVSFVYVINKQPFKAWVETDEKANILSIYVYAPFKVLPNKLQDTKILFNHINNSNVWGGITCDDEKGSIRWRHSIDFEDTEPSIAAIENAFRVGGDIFKMWFDEITLVALTQATAQEIINYLNQTPEPEGVEAFDDYVKKQGYPSPLNTFH